MKKNLLLLVLVLLAFVVVGQPTIQIPYVDDGAQPVIDGLTDDLWDNIDEVYIEIDAEDDFGTASINEAWFKMAWDDENLYLLIYRDDDDFADLWKTGLADWQSDWDEIFIDVNVNNLDDGIGASYSQGDADGASYGHYQFTSIWVQDASEWTGSPTQWYHNRPFEFGYVFETDNSYLSEYKFPFTSLSINTELVPDANATFVGEEGVVIGLEIVVADVDMADNPTDESFRKFLRWADITGWDTMDGAGQVELVYEVGSSVQNNTGKNAIKAYPNPTSDYLRLSNIDNQVDVEVLNVLGKVVLSSTLNKNSYLNIKSLVTGVYYVRIDGDQTVRFVKR